MTRTLLFTLCFASLAISSNSRAAKQSTLKPTTTPVKVRLGDRGLLAFDEGSGVVALETTLAAVLGQLVYVDESYRIQPGLLESYSWNPKSGSYLLKLKKNLKFHNGRIATARDLEFSLARGLIGKENTWFKSFFSNIQGATPMASNSIFKSGMISGLKVKDSRTLEVRLKAPNPSFLHSLARSYFSLVPKEALKSDYKTWRTHPIGAGPYKITSVDRSKSKIILTKISEDVGPSPDLIEINTSKSAILDCDICVEPRDITNLYSKESLGRAAGVTMILFNSDTALGRDPDFRKALDLAINRNKLVAGIPTFRPTMELLPAHFWGRTKRYDAQAPNRSKSILKKFKALKNKPIRVPVFGLDATHPVRSRYLGRLKTQLKEVGINLVFFATNKKFASKGSKYPMKIITLGSDVTDPLVLFNLFRERSPFAPYAPKRSRVYLNLIANASTANSLSKRNESVRNLSTYFYKNRLAIPLFEKRVEVLVRKSLKYKLGKQDAGLALLLTRLHKGALQ